jgi:hypothetical protein
VVNTTLILKCCYVFLTSGALIAFIGIGNLPPFNPEGPVWFHAALAMVGLLLVTDSVLVYRRGFMQVLEKKKGVFALLRKRP